MEIDHHTSPTGKAHYRPLFIQHNLPEPFYRRIEGPHTGFTMLEQKLPKYSLLAWNSPGIENSLECIQA